MYIGFGTIHSFRHPLGSVETYPSWIRGLLYWVKISGGSGQDGGSGRNASLPCTTKTRITATLKTINSQQCQKIKLHGTPTTKELKKHSPRLVGGAERRGRVARCQIVWVRCGWLNKKLKTQNL